MRSRPVRRLAALLAVTLSPGAAPALSVGFEAAAVVDGAIVAPGLIARPRTPADAIPGWAGGGTGGALGLADLGPDGFGGGRGAALSTRDLSFPYGFTVELAAPAAAAAAAWLAANEVWEVAAFDALGAELAREVIAPEAGGFALRAPGMMQLEFVSLGGWDWLYLDALTLTAGAVASASRAAQPPPAVPLPAALPLLAAAVASLAAARRRR